MESPGRDSYRRAMHGALIGVDRRTWRGRLWPSDWPHLVFLGGSIVLLAWHHAVAKDAAFWIATDVAAALSILATAAIVRDRRRGVRARALLTVAIIPLVFTQLGTLVPIVHPRGFERELFDLDLWLCLGANPVHALQSLAHPVLTEVLQWIYDFYFFIALILGVAVYRKRDDVALARMTHAFTVCVYLSYVGYYLVPARGPNIDPLGLYSFDGPMPGLFMTGELRETIFIIEKIKQDCFPSGHTAVSLLALTLARRFAREVVPLLWPLVLALVFSTVYLRYHYLADVLAGIVLALAVHRLAPAAHMRFEKRHWRNHGDPI